MILSKLILYYIFWYKYNYVRMTINTHVIDISISRVWHLHVWHMVKIVAPHDRHFKIMWSTSHFHLGAYDYAISFVFDTESIVLNSKEMRKCSSYLLMSLSIMIKNQISIQKFIWTLSHFPMHLTLKDSIFN